MQRSLIGPVVAFGELAGSAQTSIDGPWAIDWTPWQLLAAVLLVSLILFAVSLIVFVALTGLLVLLSRRASQTEASSFDLAARRIQSRRPRAPRHHSRFQRPGA
jgi:membrane protein implicated in regulation of membrane protease activity